MKKEGKVIFRNHEKNHANLFQGVYNSHFHHREMFLNHRNFDVVEITFANKAKTTVMFQISLTIKLGQTDPLQQG